MNWWEDASVVARYESKVDRSGECHLWRASRLPTGYGRFVLIKPVIKYTYGHRLELERKLGRALKPGEHARHICDNPPCVNPDHLLAGSVDDNVRDRQERNRTARGSSVGGAKLNEADVREIIALLAVPVSCAELGRRYGVHPQSVRLIRDGRTWRHVPRVHA